MGGANSKLESAKGVPQAAIPGPECGQRVANKRPETGRIWAAFRGKCLKIRKRGEFTRRQRRKRRAGRAAWKAGVGSKVQPPTQSCRLAKYGGQKMEPDAQFDCGTG